MRTRTPRIMETSIKVSNFYTVAFCIILEYNRVAHLNVRGIVIITPLGINCMKNNLKNRLPHTTLHDVTEHGNL
jgi:hypothetical protein